MIIKIRRKRSKNQASNLRFVKSLADKVKPELRSKGLIVAKAA